MQIIKDSVTRYELREAAKEHFGDLVKAVVDVERGIMAIGGEFHSDMETLLMEREGSKREHTWGINLYPDAANESFIEYDSLINLKPALGNRTRNVDDPRIREAIAAVVQKLVV